MAIAFFSTWTTYGTWLPGDLRGWYLHGRGLQQPDAVRRFESALLLKEDAVTLDKSQRELVEWTITKHCAIRGWELHAVNCRSNHVHVVVNAGNRGIEVPREQFKAWSTRLLSKSARTRIEVARQHWWTDRGWDEYVDDEDALSAVVAYVREGQQWSEP